MKIVCDNCATKYSIADEKVRGKVFKIRCKKCSHIIVVKGVEGEVAVDSGAAPAADVAAEEPAPVGDGWHVVVNGEQVGPLSPAEVRAKFAGGEIDAETFAWKEGFGDWQRLASIDDFSDLASAPPAADMTRRTGSDDLFGSGNDATSASNDLFGGPGADLFAGSAPAAAPAPASVGLFGQPAGAEPQRRSQPTPGFGNRAIEDAPAPVAAAPSEGPGKAMTGQRNENSVLFSLNNLQALASGGPSGPKAQAPSSNAAGIDNRPGFANSQTEGSGLIDIRAMAAATLSTSPSSSRSHSGDLPAFSSAPVFSPIAAPILMPSAASGPPKWVWPIVGLGGAAVIAIVTVGVLLLNKKPDQVAVAPVAPVGAPGAVAPGAVAPAAVAPVAVGTAPVAAAPVAVAAADHGGKGAHAGKATKGGAAPAVAGKPGAKADAPVAVGAAEPAAPARKPKKGGDELDDLLNGASPDKPAKHAAAAESSDDSLPEQLNKGQIVSGMHALSGGVHDCFSKFNAPGMVSIALTIGKSGHVSSASATGSFAGTPTGDCVARAVKGGSFPAFKGAPQSITYPFVLK